MVRQPRQGRVFIKKKKGKGEKVDKDLKDNGVANLIVMRVHDCAILHL